MPTPRWSILFQRIRCDSEAVRSVARPRPGSAGYPALGNHPVAGRDRGPDRDDGAGDSDPARSGGLPSRERAGLIDAGRSQVLRNFMGAK